MKSLLTVAHSPLLSKLLRIMKVTTFLMLAFALQLSAKGIGQDRLTFKFKKTEIAGILTYIEKETNYRFLYNQQLTDIRQKISIDVENVSINQALDHLFEKTSLIYQFMGNNLIVVKDDEAPKPISGTITDESGKPLVGVSVLVKGSSRGTTTNSKGEYTIDAEENDVLVFSYVGYEPQEFKVGGNSSYSISLASVKKDLETVVVIGYGQVKKRDLTGSVVSVKAEEIKKVPSSNIMESLQGKLPGADIVRMNGSASSGVNITIRGNRSITAGNGPLFIVDGIQYSSIQDLNPNDVQSMEVLKDASSTAVYGSRGANGVIIVTTKKGSTGKPRISINSYYGVSSLDNYPDYMSSQQYANLRRDANRRITQAGINPGGIWSSSANDGLLFTSEELNNLNNGVYTNYNDLIFQDGSQQEHQIGVSAGSDKTKAYLSLSYYKEEGIFKNDVLERYTGRLNLDQSLGKIAKVGMQMQFSYYDIDLRTSPVDEASKISSFSKPYDSLGNVILSPNNEAARWNPLIDEQPGIAVNNTIIQRTFGIVYAELTPFKGFSVRSNLGMIFNNSRQGAFFDNNSLFRRGQGAQALYTTTTGRNTTWENIFTYTGQVNDHSFVVTGVTSFLQNNYEDATAQGDRQILPSQLYYALGNATSGITIASSYRKDNLISYTGRVNYSFKGKYLATASVRTDGSSKLGEGNKWDVFPSFAVAWRLSDEDFLANSPDITDLKLRLSYGVTGNDAIPPYRTQSGLYRIPNAFGENPALGFSFSDTIGNPALKWEKTKAFNVGVDFGLFKNRISGTIDFYKTNTSDLLLLRQLPSSSGVSVTYDNVGKTENTGIDVALNFGVIRKSDMTFNVGLTFYSNKERIVFLPNNTNDIANLWFIGYPVQVIFDYEKTGIWQMADSTLAATFNQKPGDIRVLDQNKSNTITTDDRKVLGQLVPKWNGSLNLDFRYKGFDVNVFVFARIGQMMTYAYNTRFHMAGRENSAVMNYWTPENASNEYPRPRTTAAFASVPYSSTLAYEDASFVKIRSITLGYTLPKATTEKFGVSNLRFYVSGKNLFGFSKIENYDVERGGALNNPLTSLVLAGLSVDF